MMSAAFVFAAPVFARGERLDRAVRWIFITSFVLTIVSLIVLSLVYGYDLEYRFECAVILIDCSP
ncbi:hypothetical protein GWN42_02490 [candidate division KSB1 bacterium]|nr:hypothetical protein [candidate division KSB1 bacterium]